MTRSERMYKKGLCEAYIMGMGNFEAVIIKNCNEIPNLRYIGTDYDAIVNGKDAVIDIYEDIEMNIYGIVRF